MQKQACLPACVYETAAALMKSRLVNAEVFEVCEKIPTYLPFGNPVFFLHQLDSLSDRINLSKKRLLVK
ncbi:hypothetical protein T03_6337 [Trichinella britovi]|uniref:Uncharacterized protein n=1 Tax=Trichinella britovi TaxID=45882 RepID=A0A0V1D7S1_TRIBR|nr:hypothetical protein T03_6337 [Trichinella britovi]KRZ86241.1 hypothetical protein T08_9569 [Trichinella sp. T8]